MIFINTRVSLTQLLTHEFIWSIGGNIYRTKMVPLPKIFLKKSLLSNINFGLNVFKSSYKEV